MGLTIWNNLADPYNHEQLAGNFSKLDQHDHSPGRGNQIPTGGIADGAVTAAKMAPGASAIADGSISSAKLTNDAVSPANLDTWKYSAIASAESTTSATPVALTTTGPQIPVTVPANGILELVGSVEIKTSNISATASVCLFEDGVEILTLGVIPAVANTYYTYTFGSGISLARVISRGVLYATPGAHTYEVRYKVSGGFTATFQNRKLWLGIIDPN
jgi:hypothetical protein